MLRRIELQRLWEGEAVADPGFVVGSHPNKVFYELAGQGVMRMSLNLVSALAEYRHAPSSVDCRSIDDVVAWLRGCSYERDIDQFGTGDVWIHPTDFELTRRGDCEDHALWAFNRLAHLGHEVRFVAGESPGGGGHAWVNVRAPDGAWLLMETTDKKDDVPSWTPTVLAGAYRPAWSVDQHLLYHRFTEETEWLAPG